MSKHGKRMGATQRVLAALALLAVVVPGTPAMAARSVTYFGQANFRTISTLNFPLPGALHGVHDFSAVFRYDDALEMTSGSFSVDGIARKSFTCPLFLYCQALAIGPTAIGSSAATTPEDGMFMSVFSPSGFGGTALLGPGHQAYDIVAADETLSYLAFTIFYDPARGFAYSEGEGMISRIETGIPEPEGWALMIAGFGLAGAAMRRARRDPVAA